MKLLLYARFLSWKGTLFVNYFGVKHEHDAILKQNFDTLKSPCDVKNGHILSSES